MGHPQLQLLPGRGAQLFEQRRRPLDGRLPLRRHPDGRDFPGHLLAGRPGPRGQPGGAGFSAPAQPRPEPALAHRRLHRRGLHQLPQDHRAHPLRRHRLRLQVGHGLDARHPRLLRHPLRGAAGPVRQTAVQYAVLLQRAVPAGAEPRRGGPRQKDHHRQALGQLRGKVQPGAHPLLLYVHPPGQEAELHGQRAGPLPRVGREKAPGLEPAGLPLPRQLPEIFRRAGPHLRQRAGPLRRRVRPALL